MKAKFIQHDLVKEIDPKFTGVVKFNDAWITIVSGQIHKLSGAAIIYEDGSKFWYNSGIPHRIGGPAIEWADGSVEWLQNNLWHRFNGPARILFGENDTWTKEWWDKGKLHRYIDPAVIHSSGHKEWWIDGKRHNSTGPAIVHADGRFEYWMNDSEYSREEFEDQLTDSWIGI